MAATQIDLLRRLVGVALFAAAFVTAAAAQQAAKPNPEAVRALAANYALANADGDRKCPITLDAKPAGPVLTLVFDRPACVALFAFLGDVAGWLPGPGGSIRLTRANARPVLEFTEGAGGTYEGIREGKVIRNVPSGVIRHGRHTLVGYPSIVAAAVPGAMRIVPAMRHVRLKLHAHVVHVRTERQEITGSVGLMPHGLP